MSELAGPNIVLLGESGTGKTYSIGTLVETGVPVSFLALEPGIESLFGYYTDRGKPIPPNLSWHILRPPESDFASMIDTAEKINTYSFKMLADMTDPNRNKYNQFVSLLRTLNDFVDERTGEKLGPVNKWGPERFLIIDALTGINRAALDLVAGSKPARSMSDWGIAQDQIERILRMLTQDCKCGFVLISHVEKEKDEITGSMKLTMSTLGKALAPKLPLMFSDLIYTYRDGKEFWWSTENSSVTLKTRNLPIADKIRPDFAAILKTWKKRSEESAK
jgi:hypothetical protein